MNRLREEGRHVHRKRPNHRVRINRHWEREKIGSVRSGGTLVAEV
jgi:hypothetical protein